MRPIPNESTCGMPADTVRKIMGKVMGEGQSEAEGGIGYSYLPSNEARALTVSAPCFSALVEKRGPHAGQYRQAAVPV